MPVDAETARVDLRAVGVPLTLEVAGCNKGLAVTEIERVWARCLRDDGSAPAGVIRVVLDDDPEVVAGELAAGSVAYVDLVHLMHDLSPRVTDLALRLRAHDPVALLHAGGVCGEDGSTVVLVGPSGAGKTTAVRRLSAHLGYVSDETIALAPDLTLPPYPKPFSVLDRGDAWKTQHSPDELGVGATPESARAAAIVVLDRRPDVAGVEVEELDDLEAMSILAPQIAFLAARYRPLHRLAVTLQRVGPVLRVRYSEADELLPLVRRLSVRRLLEETDDRPWLDPLPAPGASASGPWALVPLRDLYRAPGGRVALLVDEQFVVLSPSAGAIVLSVSMGRGDDHSLIDAAITGAPSEDPITPELAGDLVRQLAEAGLLVHREDAEAGPVTPSVNHVV